jgi:hypothetical protein
MRTPSFVQIKSLKILQPLFHKTCENGLEQLHFVVNRAQQR